MQNLWLGTARVTEETFLRLPPKFLNASHINTTDPPCTDSIRRPAKTNRRESRPSDLSKQANKQTTNPMAPAVDSFLFPG